MDGEPVLFEICDTCPKVRATLKLVIRHLNYNHFYWNSWNPRCPWPRRSSGPTDLFWSTPSRIETASTTSKLSSNSSKTSVPSIKVETTATTPRPLIPSPSSYWATRETWFISDKLRLKKVMNALINCLKLGSGALTTTSFCNIVLRSEIQQHKYL